MMLSSRSDEFGLVHERRDETDETDARDSEDCQQYDPPHRLNITLRTLFMTSGVAINYPDYSSG